MRRPLLPAVFLALLAMAPALAQTLGTRADQYHAAGTLGPSDGVMIVRPGVPITLAPLSDVWGGVPALNGGCGTNQWVDAIAAGALHCDQPSIDQLTGAAGVSVNDPGTGTLEFALPYAGAIGGATKSFGASDTRKWWSWSDGGVAMAGTLPAGSGTAGMIVIDNTDASAAITFAVAGGGWIGHASNTSLALPAGNTVTLVPDGAGDWLIWTDDGPLAAASPGSGLSLVGTVLDAAVTTVFGRVGAITLGAADVEAVLASALDSLTGVSGSTIGVVARTGAGQWVLGNVTMTVSSIAALQALTIPWPTVDVQGYYGAGDNGGGAMVSIGTTCTPNGVTTYASASGICYARVRQSPIRPEWAGMIAGGADANTQATTNVTRWNSVIEPYLQGLAASYSQSAKPRVDMSGTLYAVNGTLNLDNVAAVVIDQPSLVVGGTTAWTAGAGSTTSHTYTTPSESVTVSLWMPPHPWSGTYPIGMIDIGSGSSNVQIVRPNISCARVGSTTPDPNCTGITNAGYETQIVDLQVSSWALYGLFSHRALDVDGCDMIESNTLAGRTGYGIYLAMDSGAQDTAIARCMPTEGYVGIYNDGLSDVRIDSSHPWTSVPSGDATPLIGGGYNIVYDDAGSGSIVSSTIDNGEILIETNAAGLLGKVTIANHTLLTGYAVFDAWLTLRGKAPSNNGANLAFPVAISGAVATNPASGSKSPLYAGVVLEDASGSLDPTVWAKSIRQQVGALNFPAFGSAAYVDNVLQDAAGTFTGSVAAGQSGTITVTAASFLPSVGTAVSDTGSCLSAATLLLALSMDNTFMVVAPVPAATCSSDSITVGGLTVTGTVTSGSATVTFTAPFSLQAGRCVTDSAGALPAHTYWSGYAAPGGDGVPGTVILSAPSGTTTAATGDTFTLSANCYVPQPEDSGKVLLSNSGSTTNNLYLISLGATGGWYVWIDQVSATNELVVTPGSGIDIGGSTSAITFTQTHDASSRLSYVRSTNYSLLTNGTP